MSLEKLFIDRTARKTLRDYVYEGTEIGKGTCESCGRERPLIDVVGKKICESCCSKILDVAENYDNVFESDVDESYVSEILDYDNIYESYVSPDMKKLQDDANKKFKGSIPDLLKSYGMNPHREWDDNLSKGMIYIRDNEISGGKTKLNQFLIDYDCSFSTEKSAKKLVPDKDGTMAPLKVKGKIISNQAQAVNISSVPSSGSKPATTSGIPTQSSSHVVKNVGSVGPDINVQGDNDEFTVELSKTLVLKCKKNKTSNSGKFGIDVTLGNNTVGMYAEGKNNKEIAKNLISTIIKNPELIFSAFEDGYDKDTGYTLSKYPAYSFMFDEDSFKGQYVSLAMVLNGHKYNNRVQLMDKDLMDKVKLNKEINVFMDSRLTKVYPMLFNGTADPKISIGKAITELISIDTSSTDKLGEVNLVTSIGNRQIPWKSSGSRFKEKEPTKNAIFDLIYMNMEKLIPDWNSSTMKSTVNDEFVLKDQKLDKKSYTVYAKFELSDLYDTQDIMFRVRIKDDITGKILPENGYETVVYRQAGTKLEDLLKSVSPKIYTKLFSKGLDAAQLSEKAVEKIKSPSRKLGFCMKLAYEIMYNILKLPLESEVEDLDIDKEGRLVKCTLRIYDPDKAVSTSSFEMNKFVMTEPVAVDLLKVINIEDGDYPSVLYDVNIDDLTKIINVSLLESMILGSNPVIEA